MRRWIRTIPDQGDDAGALMAAGVAAAIVGTTVWYFTRMLLAREELAAPSVPVRARPADPSVMVEAGPRGPEETRADGRRKESMWAEES